MPKSIITKGMVPLFLNSHVPCFSKSSCNAI
jgi:hypothetical protein